MEFQLGDLPSNQLLEPGAYGAILRVAQEALANIGRHARANTVTVSIGSRGRAVVLQIKDDGAGFDPLHGQRGMGIRNMTARADEFGGKFELESHPGGGTIVTFSVPLAYETLTRYRNEMLGQMLLFCAMFMIVLLYVPQQFRPFCDAAWLFAGTARVLFYKRALDRMRKHGPATL